MQAKFVISGGKWIFFNFRMKHSMQSVIHILIHFNYHAGKKKGSMKASLWVSPACITSLVLCSLTWSSTIRIRECFSPGLGVSLSVLIFFLCEPPGFGFFCFCFLLCCGLFIPPTQGTIPPEIFSFPLVSENCPVTRESLASSCSQ